MALAIVACGALGAMLPEDFRVVSGPTALVYPLFLIVLLGVLVVGDPGRIDRDRPWLQVTTGVMIGVITLVNAVSALRLIVGILTNAPFSWDPSSVVEARGDGRFPRSPVSKRPHRAGWISPQPSSLSTPSPGERTRA